MIDRVRYEIREKAWDWAEDMYRGCVCETCGGNIGLAEQMWWLYSYLSVCKFRSNIQLERH